MADIPYDDDAAADEHVRQAELGRPVSGIPRGRRGSGGRRTLIDLDLLFHLSLNFFLLAYVSFPSHRYIYIYTYHTVPYIRSAISNTDHLYFSISINKHEFIFYFFPFLSFAKNLASSLAC